MPPVRLATVLILGSALIVSACAETTRVQRGPLRGGQAERADRQAAPDRRQYYDERRKRHYYYDPRRQAYFWENGSPKS